jgi:hypothetical protein
LMTTEDLHACRMRLTAIGGYLGKQRTGSRGACTQLHRKIDWITGDCGGNAGAGEGNRTLVVSLGSRFGAFDIIEHFRKDRCLSVSWTFVAIPRCSPEFSTSVPNCARRSSGAAHPERRARAFTPLPAAPAA